MIPGNIQIEIKNTARIIRSARYLVAFTGAGISTPSGIPDFRSSGIGLWNRDDPMRVASLTAFRKNPDVFFNWLHPLLKQSLSASPNPAHFALAELEKMGILRSVITQNIDHLHQRGGTQKVLELHGNLDTFSCGRCHQKYRANNFIEAFIENMQIPRCPACDSILKPDIVLYEELLPREVWQAAEDEVHRADVMLVIGSSLEVYPAASLPTLAVQHGCQLLINNLSPTPQDRDAASLLRWNTAEVMPMIVNELRD